jgi:hypothetical protein
MALLSAVGRSARQFRSANVGAVTQTNMGFRYKSVHTLDLDEAMDEYKITHEAPVDLARRFAITAEVVVSKIFAAGFGWQAGSIIAAKNGFAADTGGFAITTGFFDGLGVFSGHVLWYLVKSLTVDKSVNMAYETQTGLLLGTAALFSGTAWQPAVNAFTTLGFTFPQAATATTAVCFAGFYVGLRVARHLYGGWEHVVPASYKNLKHDAQLALSVGGAGGAFVGTDISFSDNFLRPVIGIEESMSNLQGMVAAGSATGLGFGAFQTVQNVAMQHTKIWAD